ncbi:hypothetical protein ICE93_06810 [Polynucleobacter sp. MWH-HuK1]|nr:hypothetical protein [Polynucleobacter sp. MWH-HuK1]
MRVVASKYHHRGWNTALGFGFIVTLVLLTACAAPLAALSSSGTAAASSAGTAAIANPSTAASLASTAATGKSPLEHAASAATKKECSFFNVIDSKPICIEVVLPTVTDKSEPLLGPADLSKDTAKQ